MSLLAGLVGTQPPLSQDDLDNDDTGSRIRNIDFRRFTSFSCCHYLIFILYAFSIAFLFSAAILVSETRSITVQMGPLTST
jgi:hypothetical protein